MFRYMNHRSQRVHMSRRNRRSCRRRRSRRTINDGDHTARHSFRAPSPNRWCRHRHGGSCGGLLANMHDRSTRRSRRNVERRRLVKRASPSWAFRWSSTLDRSERHCRRCCCCCRSGGGADCSVCDVRSRSCHETLSASHSATGTGVVVACTAIGHVLVVFVPVFGAAPESVAFAPRGTLALFPAILRLATASAFSELPRVLFPTST